MRKIQWSVVIGDNNRIMSLEEGKGFPQDDIETHLTIIGILENLKQKHLDKLNTLYDKTIGRGDKNELEL